MTGIGKLKPAGLKGAGYFCTVKKYSDEVTGKNYALKQLRKKHVTNEEYRYRFLREILLLKELQDHKNIIELIDFSKGKDDLWYMMPFANDNLYDFIKRNNTKLSKKQRYRLVGQVINAVKFAHSKGILHRDLSPTNVLIFEEDKKVITKVCDFGLGKDKKSLSYYTRSSASGYGQILYVSPEQREKLNEATVKSDIYSLGKLVYFIFTGKDPDNIKSFELYSLVQKATEENPENRFRSVLEFKKHFTALKDLELNQKIPEEYVTLKDIVKSGEKFSWFQFHNLVKEGKYLDHIYSDFLEPVFKILKEKENLRAYYKEVGASFSESFQKVSESLFECYNTTRWPFDATKTFGKVLTLIAKEIPDPQTRLLCLKNLWHLAYVMDQWSVQYSVSEVFNTKIITSDIETQLSEFIMQSEPDIEISKINSIHDLPQGTKSAIIRAVQITKEKERKRREEMEGKDDY